ncbi:unnamed protein product, partial [Iphiclides podalirius]
MGSQADACLCERSSARARRTAAEGRGRSVPSPHPRTRTPRRGHAHTRVAHAKRNRRRPRPLTKSAAGRAGSQTASKINTERGEVLLKYPCKAYADGVEMRRELFRADSSRATASAICRRVAEPSRIRRLRLSQFQLYEKKSNVRRE